MVKFSHQARQVYIQRLKEETFDVVIIGGGITGAGIAMQAAASGMKAALIEMQDFAEGTSSRSTKLVHGGIRYLKQFDVEVVAETVSERAVVQHIAPHIPKPDPMLLPLYDEPGASYSIFELEVAMDLYDSLANITDGPYANKMLTTEEVLQRQPNLLQDKLIGGGSYLDFNNNDSRLVIENIKQAQTDGAVPVNRLKAIGFTYIEDKQLTGVTVEDMLGDEQFSIETKLIVNATGPWVDTVRELDTKVEDVPMMRPTKGVHLVIDRDKLSVSQPVYFDSGDNDKRMIFVLPRFGKTYFGTTDTDYEGELAKPKVDRADVDYLIKAVNHRFPDANLTLADIESSWAGLRPLILSHASSDYNGGNKQGLSDEVFKQLVTLFDDYRDDKVSRLTVEKEMKELLDSSSNSEASPSSVSRGSELLVDDSGLITIAGGKITDYRKMAEAVMQEVNTQLSDRGKIFSLVDSANYKISGGQFAVEEYDQVMLNLTKLAMDKGITEEASHQLATLYGTNLPQVLEGFSSAARYADKYEVPIEVAVSLVYALDYEMTYTAIDFFLRRTNYMLFDIKALDQLAEPTLLIIKEHLDLSDEEYETQVQLLKQEIDEHSLAYLK